MALRNGSETPISNPFDLGHVVLVAAERVDHARSTVFCASRGRGAGVQILWGTYWLVTRWVRPYDVF